jgi:hypothetical protein
MIKFLYSSAQNYFYDTTTSKCVPRVGLGSTCSSPGLSYECYYGTGLWCVAGSPPTCQCTTSSATEATFGGEFEKRRKLAAFYFRFNLVLSNYL